MSSASTGMIFAGGIFITCLTISMGILCFRMGAKMSQASATVINQNTVEYLEADISGILANSHTGASVKQYVNKYRRTLVVEIQTIKASKAHQIPLSVTATSSTELLTSDDSYYFVLDSAMFNCEAERDSNGNYRLIRFTQLGAVEEALPESPVTDAASARGYLITALGGRADMTWADIVEATQSIVLESRSAKAALVNEISSHGTGTSVTTDSTWESIISSAASIMDNYHDALDGAINTEGHNRESFRLSPGETKNLPFIPTTVIITNSSRASFVWTSENGIGWITELPDGVGIAGQNILYTSTTGYVDVIAYN